MKATHLLLCLGLLLPACASAGGTDAAAPPTTQPADSAEAAAQHYCGLLKAGHGVEAVAQYWDLDAMFDAIFGDDMKKVSDDDRTQMHALMLGFLHRLYPNPKIIELMSQAKFTGFAERSADGDHAVVSFTLELQDKSIPNAPTMVRHDGRWRVTDAATNGQGLVGVVQKQYAAHRGKIAPPVFIKAVTLGS